MAFVTYPHPALSATAAEQPVDDTLVALGRRLDSAAREARAYGLAGAHLGEPMPVILLNISPEAGSPDYRVYYNPVVTKVGDVIEAGTEGSVSLPGVEVIVDRPTWAEISYKDAAGNSHTQRFEGFVARCALHEIDQVNGVFFLDRVSRLKREMALKKFHKRQRAG